MPQDRTYDFEKPADRAAFADAYMARLRGQEIDVIALADHHTGGWIADMQAAGARAGVTVFPGVEITTGSGSDGAHLVVIGELDKSEHDIDVLLSTVCRFDERDNPRFNPSTKKKTPAPSPRSIADILADLPEGWLAFAPHVLSENGLASPGTAKGTIRWKALHHDRLSAVDVGRSGDDGNLRDEGAVGFNHKFRTRSLKDFPCLDRMAFISTSDAYRLEDLGSRFSWIRMNSPTLEGLRQAFLDHEARIIRVGDERLARTENPNKVEHAWIESVNLAGELGNSGKPLRILFNPRLNVIIGGRGTGKSTVVAALRQIYGTTDGLPDALRAEASDFVSRVFSAADLHAVHHLAISDETQEARWQAGTSSITQRGSTATPTTFPVRLFAQKELYERIKSDPQDLFSASRNLVALIDAAIAADGHGSRDDFRIAQSASENGYEHAVRSRQQLQAELARRGELTARASELRAQIEALDAADLRQRRDVNAQLMRERADVEAEATGLENTLRELRHHVDELLRAGASSNINTTAGSEGVEVHRQVLRRIRSELQTGILSAISQSEAELKAAEHSRQEGPWAERVRLAVLDDAECQAQLAALGVAPEQYLSLRDELSAVEAALADLDRRQQVLSRLSDEESDAWDALLALTDGRARRRAHLINGIEERSGTLRFALSSHADWVGWVTTARELLNLRADGFIEDVRAVGRWLWSAESADLAQRLHIWRAALIDGDTAQRRAIEQAVTGARRSWWDRLWRFDPAVRLRLAMQMADDVITMCFLKNGGSPDRDQDWQDVSHGSPGQRGAAMLSFVLHHGSEPLILDQPEDDLDTSLISDLIVTELRKSRWTRQLIVVTHNANIPVLGDAEQITVMDAIGTVLSVKQTQGVEHSGPVEVMEVRRDIQDMMEGGVAAFIMREKRYDNELSQYRRDLDTISARAR
jgi:energy-coupling factor transporter ATP-binding protein EcfA2